MLLLILLWLSLSDANHRLINLPAAMNLNVIFFKQFYSKGQSSKRMFSSSFLSTSTMIQIKHRVAAAGNLWVYYPSSELMARALSSFRLMRRE